MNKFNARKTTCQHGHSHASAKEARRCGELHLLFRAGQIDALVVEPQYWFAVNGIAWTHPGGRRFGYKPDFSYIEKGRVVVEEVKGRKATITEASRLRMTVFQNLNPDIELRVV